MNSHPWVRFSRYLAIAGALFVSLSLVFCFVDTQPGKVTGFGFIADAHAEEGGHSSHTGGHGGGGAGRGGGHSEGGHSGHDDDGHEGHSGGQKGKGRGRSDSHDAVRGGKTVEDRVLRGGGKPWAREGIPEIELGRLNVARAPGHVLARAEQEALAGHNEAMTMLYSLSAEQAATLLETRFSEIERYDSPLQNLALYKDVMTFGVTQLPNVKPASQLDLAAIFLGSAADKTVPVSEKTVAAVNIILGRMEMEADDQATLANKAEVIREAILAGHGDEPGH